MAGGSLRSIIRKAAGQPSAMTVRYQLSAVEGSETMKVLPPKAKAATTQDALSLNDQQTTPQGERRNGSGAMLEFIAGS